MNAFLRWLFGPKLSTDSLGVVVVQESYLRLRQHTKVPPQWTAPLREGEDEVIEGSLREHEPREYHADAISRIRAEERAKAKAVEQEFVNQLQEVLS